MEHRTFDTIARAMAGGVSRRGILKRFAGTAVAGPFAVLGVDAARADGDNKKDRGNDRKDDRARCRGTGQACSGNRDCCPGLVCDGGACLAPGGGTTTQGIDQTQQNQTVTTNNQVCAGDCANQTQNTSVTNQQSAVNADDGSLVDVSQVDQQSLQTFGTTAGGFTTLPPFQIEVECNYESAAFQTVCVALGRGIENAPRIQKISLPSFDICAIVIDEESRPSRWREEIIEVEPERADRGGGGGQASAGTGGVADADASGGTVTIGDVNSGGNRGDDNDTNISVDASGGTANADASGGSGNVAVVGGGGDRDRTRRETITRFIEEEPASLTVTLEGNVVPGRQTTYWLDTDAGRLPATGPALTRVEEESPDAGAIVVDAARCDIPAAEEGFDWFGRCQTPAAPIAFDVFPAGSSGGSPVASGTSNERGRIRFPNLTPGTYRLTPTDGTWCHAESNSVDAEGNVVVQPGSDSNVWIFTCGG